MPGQPDFLETDERLKAISRTLSVLYRGKVDGLRVADLGSLEGGFALALASRGAQVLGIEARVRNLEKAHLLEEHFELENLKFVLGDVKDFSEERFGVFDIVLALGIVYHLDDPIPWLRQIASATKTVLIVDSHYAPVDDAGLAKMDPRISHLGPLEQIQFEGWTCEGRWFKEYDSKADREAQLWASYSNRSSFWLTKESLLLGLVRAGFDLVVEQHDYSAHLYRYFSVTYPRAMIVAIKTSHSVS
jgi:predicted nicotinamide N-methyase